LDSLGYKEMVEEDEEKERIALEGSNAI